MSDSVRFPWLWIWLMGSVERSERKAWQKEVGEEEKKQHKQ